MVKKDAFPEQEINLKDSVAYLRRDSFELQGLAKGWNIVKYNGVNLGFVKNIVNRINNYYPVEWRIRMDIPVTVNESFLLWGKS